MSNVDRREHPRFAVKLPGMLTRLSGPEPAVPVLIEDVSEGGILFDSPEALECGSFIVVEIEDSTLAGEIKYCRPGASGYQAGVLVERVLIGESALSRLIENMLTSA